LVANGSVAQQISTIPRNFPLVRIQVAFRNGGGRLNPLLLQQTLELLNESQATVFRVDVKFSQTTGSISKCLGMRQQAISSK